MENTLNLSVILPIKTSLERDFDELFKKAISSITTQSVLPKELVIVYAKSDELSKYLETFELSNIEVKKIPFEGEPNYSSQINLGVKNSTGEWISFFEFDDEYSQIWFKNVKKYSEIYSDVEAFLPIVIDVDNK